MDNLSLFMPVFNNNEERVFILTIVLMELRFAVALPHMFKAIKAVANQDDAALIEALKRITEVVESVASVLDYLTPNEHSKYYVDPTIWSKTVAKFDGKIPGGLPGLSASVFPLFHTLDSFIQREVYESVLGQAITDKYLAQPKHVFEFISAMRRDLEKFSLRAYVKKSNNPLLRNQYQCLVDAYLGESGLTNVHSTKAYGYLKINFRSGRLETNGKQRGTATVETEEQRKTIANFRDADSERRKNLIPQSHYATRVRITHFNNTACEVILDVSQAGLSFAPGDHCAILPVNSDVEINNLVKRYGINLNLEIELNAEWQQFFFHKLGVDIKVAPVTELLKHVDTSQSSQWQTNPFNLNSVHPLAPRFYSVSPITQSAGQIRLTIARHNYVGENGEPLEGKASGYLIRESTTSVHIDKIPARSFHLPSDPQTPVLMFAAGTGISPFMGFIDARKNQDKSGLNWLFLSTQNRGAFYYDGELQEHVRNKNLRLNVIFSREQEIDTVEFDENKKAFVYGKKYQGKHVNELIKENAQTISKLIMQGAHIYICGNNGFSVTVRNSIKSALLANNNLSESEVEEYLQRMFADQRYHSDVFTPSHGEKLQQPSQQIFRSEVAYHNKVNDCWVIINGSVYDLTQFCHIHPGGRKILHISAGMNVSEDYNQIKHNQNPQVEAQLAQYKIGVLREPRFTNEKSAAIYAKCVKYLEVLLEMQNTLSNSSTFVYKEKPAYLWREVYSVFIQGHLQSYDPKGTVGSFSYAFNTLLNDLSKSLGFKDDHFSNIYTQLFELAYKCGDIIRGSTVDCSLDKIKKIEKVFYSLIDETIQFIETMKRLFIDIAKKLEATAESGSELDHDTVSKLVNNVEAAMSGYMSTLTKYHSLLTIERKPFIHPFVANMSEGGVCPFAPTRKPSDTTPSAETQAVAVDKEQQAKVASNTETLSRYASSTFTFISSWATSAVQKVTGAAPQVDSSQQKP